MNTRQGHVEDVAQQLLVLRAVPLLFAVESSLKTTRQARRRQCLTDALSILVELRYDETLRSLLLAASLVSCCCYSVLLILIGLIFNFFDEAAATFRAYKRQNQKSQPCIENLHLISD